MNSLAAGDLIGTTGIRADAFSTLNGLDFSQVSWSHGKVGAIELAGSTNVTEGYSIFISQDHNLQTPNGDIIGNFTANTGSAVSVTSPVPWVKPAQGGYLGFSIADQDGKSQFKNGALWAAIPMTPTAALSRTATNELKTYVDSLLLKLELGEGQKAGIYENTITVTIVPNIPQ